MFAKILFALVVLAKYGEGYYWRDWNGAVPSDAFVAGRDDRGVAYIAKAYVPNKGVFIGEIFAGQEKIYTNSELSSSHNSSSTSTFEIEVLCSDISDLQWIVSSYSKFPEIEDNKSLYIVKGGVDINSSKSVYIGRYTDGENLYIGNVAYQFLYYSNVNATNEFWITYELLVVPNN